MVQEFHVLCCFSCHTFQVHQVKKSKTWTCKLCGEKQSLIKVFGQGSAADCRRHVQKLNLLQGKVEQTAITTTGLNWQNDACENDYDSTQSSGSSQPHIGAPVSCWSKYLEEDSENSCVKQEEEEDNGLIYTDREHFYTRQNIISEARKRKKMPQYTCDINEQDFNRDILNTSKRKRTHEDRAASIKQTDEPSYIKNENVGSTGDHGRIVSPADEPTCSGFKWERDILAEDKVKEDISRTHSLQKKVTNMDPILNKIQHNQNIVLSLWSAQPKTTYFESEFPRTVHESRILSDQPSGCAPKTNDATAKPQCSIFQTDEDFDENY
ncbi:MRN complex-interacting protein isoform X1 [Rana temporaria]|uniref:MRN complex-interacting protein isoform X1 n=1 Tax=Rana temporaria TaxID=8407 RepID=UPI001AAC58AD|nr:MRN complex-interacting protein isoform X1 [Rana temporaria]